MMRESVELPKFIRLYLLGRIKLCLIVALVSAIIAGFLMFHMSATTLYDFIPNGYVNIRQATQNYGLYRLYMGLFAFTLSANAVVFIALAASVLLNIKGHPLSRMYKILDGCEGEPQAVLNHLENTLESRKVTLHSSEPFVNADFILIPRFTYVYIAPVKKLHWAYISLKVTRKKYPSSGRYYLNFHFRETGEKSIKIASKDEGIIFLKKLKKLAPHVSIGYNRASPDSQKDIL